MNICTTCKRLWKDLFVSVQHSYYAPYVSGNYLWVVERESGAAAEKVAAVASACGGRGEVGKKKKLRGRLFPGSEIDRYMQLQIVGRT